MKNAEQKESAVKEYLAGGISSLNLGLKYGCGSTTISRWAMEEQKKKDEALSLQTAKFTVTAKEDMPTEVKKLQQELQEARLKVSLLEAMIDISDEQFGTNIRKKAGTRRL